MKLGVIVKNLMILGQWLVGSFAALILVCIVAGISGCNKSVPQRTSAVPDNASGAITAADPKGAPPKNYQHNSRLAWQYISSDDELTDKKINGAYLDSSNNVSFGFPYDGGSHLTLLISHGARAKASLVISRGQFMCGFDKCAIKFRFDDGPVRTFWGTAPTDGSPDQIYINDAGSLAMALQTTYDIRIAAPFFESGYQTFHFFAVDGLDLHRLEGNN